MTLEKRSQYGAIAAVVSLVAGVLLITFLTNSSDPANIIEEADIAQSSITSFGADTDVAGQNHQLRVTNTLNSYINVGGGYYRLNYSYTICNPYGFSVNLTTATNSLTQNGSYPEGVSILQFTSPSLPLRSDFNGGNQTQMLAGSYTLGAGSCAVISLNVRVRYTPADPTIRSYVSAYGQAQNQQVSSHTSTQSRSATVSNPRNPSATSSSFSSRITSSATSSEGGNDDDSEFYLGSNPDPVYIPPCPAGKSC